MTNSLTLVRKTINNCFLLRYAGEAQNAPSIVLSSQVSQAKGTPSMDNYNIV